MPDAIVKLSRDELERTIRTLSLTASTALLKPFLEAKEVMEAPLPPDTTIDQLLTSNQRYVEVRVANALYFFCEKLEKEREAGTPRLIWDGLPIPKTIADLTKWSHAKLLAIPGIGRKSVEYLEKLLNEAGYKLEEGYLDRKFREEKMLDATGGSKVALKEMGDAIREIWKNCVFSEEEFLCEARLVVGEGTNRLKVCYHGTDGESAASIFKEGFKPGTYFGEHLEDALGFGGSYVFEVCFSKDTTSQSGWQFTTRESISRDKIVSFKRIETVEVLYENTALGKRIFESNSLDEGIG